MNRPVSAIDAIGPAIQRTRMMLFRPVDPGKWLILGFLTFLQLLGGGERYGELKFPFGSWRNHDFSWRPRRAFGWILDRGLFGASSGARAGNAGPIISEDGIDWAERVRNGSWWFTHHPVLTGGLIFVGVLFVLAIVVLFVWLSSRATFCYVDCVAKDRAEVVRPWTEHGRIADSYFFWRLIISIAMMIAVVALAIPLVLSILSMVSAGEDVDPWTILFGGGIMVSTIPAIIILMVLYALVRVFLNDFIAPIQYARRIDCTEAFRVLRQAIWSNPGAFVVYLVMKLLIWLVIYFGLFVLGCASCCILFCCWSIPVLGQAVLQPFHVFSRAFSLYFMQGFGPGFDVFPGVAAESPSAGGTPVSSGGPGFPVPEPPSGV